MQTPRRDPPIKRSDVLAALSALEPGEYLSRDLYARYVACVRSQGRVPANHHAFGQAMGRWTDASWRKAHGVGAWTLPEASAS